MKPKPQEEAVRVVRLLGGLSALDAREEQVRVGVRDRYYGGFKRPEYAKLGGSLNGLKLPQVGIEFFRHTTDLNGETPPRWEVVSSGKLAALQTRNEWSFLTSRAAKAGQLRLASLSKRIQANIDLLGYRLLQLHQAYEATLLAALLQESELRAHQFSNLWTVHIDAAIHAFLGDAGAFRDVLCEACWHLVLREDSRDVRKIGTFIRAKTTHDHPLRQAMLTAARDGWIKHLSVLRDQVIHDAPISEMHEFDYCDLRIRELPGGAQVPWLHYPLTEADWTPRKVEAEYIDFSSEHSVRVAVTEYDAFVRRSGDALEFLWLTFGRLISLTEEIRLAAGLSAPMPILTPKDGVVSIRYR